MRIKRVLQGTALTALAAAAWMGAATVDASAAEFPAGNVSVNLYSYDNEENYGTPTLNVSVPSDTKEIIFGVASFNATKGVKINDTAWDVYDTTGKDYVSIDLSKLSITKDNYVAVKSESTEPIYIKIGASVASQTAKYDAAKSTLAITIKKAVDANVKVDTANWEYRTSYGSWTYADLSKEDKYDANKEVFQEYQPQGATLYLRAAANLKETLTPITDGVKDATVKDGSKTLPLYDGGLMPGKETKVSIAKQANGPSVSADYVNGSVNIPAGTEYRVIATDGAISTTAKNDSKAAKTVAELLELTKSTTASSGTLEVRKQAKGKKSVSKWTRVAIEIPANIELAIDNSVLLVSSSSSVNKSEVAKDITITATHDSKKNQYKGSVTVSNKSDIAINVLVEGAKAVKVDAGKDKTIKAAAGKKISIAKAGDKKGKKWASGYVEVGSVSDK